MFNHINRFRHRSSSKRPFLKVLVETNTQFVQSAIKITDLDTLLYVADNINHKGKFPQIVQYKEDKFYIESVAFLLYMILLTGANEECNKYCKLWDIDKKEIDEITRKALA